MWRRRRREPPADGREASTDALRVADLERELRKVRANRERELRKILRAGYAAGPLLDVDFPGAELKLVAAADKRLDEHASEPYIPEWIEREFAEDDIFYDVGANIGTYTLIAAAVAIRTGRVVAFEPSFSTYAVLCENVFVNGLGDRVTTLPVALGSSTGLQTFNYSSLRPGAAKHNWPTGKVAFTGEVLSYRLDDLVESFALPYPNHIKIDTDGGEPDLLRGARGVLASPALRTLMVELLTWTEADVVSELGSHDFRLVERFERPPSPVTCGLFARS